MAIALDADSDRSKGRRVRTRMHGGVRGKVREDLPISIRLKDFLLHIEAAILYIYFSERRSELMSAGLYSDVILPKFGWWQVLVRGEIVDHTFGGKTWKL